MNRLKVRGSAFGVSLSSPAKGQVWLKLGGSLFPEMFNLSHAHNCLSSMILYVVMLQDTYLRMYIFLKGLQVVLLSMHHIICTLTDLLVCAKHICKNSLCY